VEVWLEQSSEVCRRCSGSGGIHRRVCGDVTGVLADAATDLVGRELFRLADVSGPCDMACPQVGWLNAEVAGTALAGSGFLRVLPEVRIE